MIFDKHKQGLYFFSLFSKNAKRFILFHNLIKIHVNIYFFTMSPSSMILEPCSWLRYIHPCFRQAWPFSFRLNYIIISRYFPLGKYKNTEFSAAPHTSKEQLNSVLLTPVPIVYADQRSLRTLIFISTPHNNIPWKTPVQQLYLYEAVCSNKLNSYKCNCKIEIFQGISLL